MGGFGSLEYRGCLSSLPRAVTFIEFIYTESVFVESRGLGRDFGGPLDERVSIKSSFIESVFVESVFVNGRDLGRDFDGSLDERVSIKSSFVERDFVKGRGGLGMDFDGSFVKRV